MDLVERYGPVRAAKMEAERRAGIRARALRRLPWVVPLPAVAVAGMVLLQEWMRPRGVPLGSWIAVVAALTALPLVMALLELSAGYEVRELAARWDSLAAWQRGVIGVLAAAGALAAFGAIAYAVAVSLAG